VSVLVFYIVFEQIWNTIVFDFFAFSALTLLVGWQEGLPACKKQWWSAGVVVCLKQGADLHTAQLMPLPLAVTCFSKIQIGFSFLVPAHLGSPRKRAVKSACARACVRVCVIFMLYKRCFIDCYTTCIVHCESKNKTPNS